MGKYGSAVLSQCWSGVLVPEQWDYRKKDKSLKDRRIPSPPSFELVEDTRSFLFCYNLQRGKETWQSFHTRELQLHHSCDWFDQWLISPHLCLSHNSLLLLLILWTVLVWTKKQGKSLSNQLKANFLSHKPTSILAQSSRLLSATAFAKPSPACTSHLLFCTRNNHPQQFYTSRLR